MCHKVWDFASTFVRSLFDTLPILNGATFPTFEACIVSADDWHIFDLGHFVHFSPVFPGSQKCEIWPKIGLSGTVVSKWSEVSAPIMVSDFRCCFMSKPEHLKVDCGRKPRHLFTPSPSPVKSRGGRGQKFSLGPNLWFSERSKA